MRWEGASRRPRSNQCASRVLAYSRCNRARQQSTTGFGIWERIEIVSVAEIHAGEVLLNNKFQGSVKAEIDGGVNPHLIGCRPYERFVARHNDKDFAARVLSLRRRRNGVTGESVRQMGLIPRTEVESLLNAGAVDKLRHLRPRNP